MITSSITTVIGTSVRIKQNVEITNNFETIDDKSEVTDESSSFSNPVTISVETEGDLTRITYHIQDFQLEKKEINGENYVSIHLEGESNGLVAGEPDLPNVRRSIIIPDTAKMELQVTNAQFEEYDNILVAPSKGDLLRNVNPDDVPYTFGEAYAQNSFFTDTIAELEETYILRDFRGQVVQINPFQYNPVTHTLRFFTYITVEIYPIGEDTANCLTRSSRVSTLDSEFKQVYEHQFINYNDNPVLSYVPVEEQGNMLIITYDSFWDEMIPFVQWKNMKGIPTEMVNVSEIGDANAIKAYVDLYYNDPGLAFLLLVGDIDQIPSLYYSGHASDPSYAYIVGSDNYQDIFVGRFSANNPTELVTQIERSIEYEKYPQAGADWYHKGTGIGSDEGIGDDNEYDWEHIRNIRTDLLGFTYTEVDEFYGGSQGGEDDPGNPSSTMIGNAMNEGRGVINYCGHGAYDGWGWSSVSGWYVFHSNDVTTLVNDNKLPFIISVACETGEFENYATCFGEAWMRATHNGEPTGGIGFFGSTQLQSWDPPMDAQDEIVDLLVAETMNTYGGLCYSGTFHMMDEYGSECYDETNTWTVFGDPSLQVRTDMPASMTVLHTPTVDAGATTFDVEVVGIENALCAISRNYELLGYAYTDGSGIATITFDEPITVGDDVDLVVTSFNKDTYITSMEVVSIRQPAEFEPMEGVLIRYPFGISYDIIAEMSEDVEVVTIVASTSEQNTVTSNYQSNGVNLSHCSFLIAPTDTYWTRDYGPWFVYNSINDEMEVVDFTYNRPRPLDNQIPAAYASDQGFTLNVLGLVHTGGNYMTDGQGIAISTDLVQTENPGFTSEEISQMMTDVCGIRTYYMVPDVLGEYIEHIDCWAKYLSPDTIMIIEVPPSNPQYDEIEAAVDYFETQLSCYDTPYEIVRVDTPGGEAYINSLILNDKVFVPMMGTSWDDDAIASYEAAMPGYEVLGFTGSWVSTDALHCRAKGIPDRDLLYIEHTPLADGFPGDYGFEVTAKIIPYSGESLIPESVGVWWKITTGDWNFVQMNPVGGDYYSAFIPPQASGETVFYYIHAEDASGRAENHPFMGAADPHTFDVTPVPDIWINPTSFNLQNDQGSSVETILTIGNEAYAGQDLDVDIAWTDDSGLGWLSVSPTTNIIQPGFVLDANVTADTQSLDIGVYEESIIITSNDPDEPLLTIPVILTVTLVNDVGAISIDSPLSPTYEGALTVSATVENFGSGDQTDVVVNCTIIEGIIGTFMYEDFQDTFPPAGWSQEEYGEWDQHDGNDAGGKPPEAYLYWNAINGDYSYLQSVPVDTIGAPVLYLSFKHFIDHYTSTFNCRVLTRADASDTWTDVTPWTNPVSGNIGPQNPVIDISHDIGSGTQVRFEFDGYYWNLDYWYVDEVSIYSSARDAGDQVYTSETTVSIPAYTTADVEFSPPWNAVPGTYAVKIKTMLPGDQNSGNDQKAKAVTVIESEIDPTQSFVTLTGLGLTTCPAGDGSNYNYVKVTMKNSQGDPIQGIPAGDFDFTVTAAPGTGYFGTLSCTFTAVDAETDANGEIRFQVTGDTSIAALSGFGAGAITIEAEVQTIALNDSDDLPCCSYDENLDGKVDLGDFSKFAVDFGLNRPRSDYDWDGDVDLSDFGLFAVHFGHNGY